MTKRVDFFYDFSCPYAYLGHTQIEAVCARAGAALVWKPFLLGGVFKAIGTPSVPATTMPAAKVRHNALDMHRWADHFGVPLSMPPTHPNRTVLALRAVLAGPATELARASKALFQAYWVSALDVSSPDVVRAALDAAGLDGAARLRGAEEPAAKDDLRARTDEAIAAGVFGAPAFVVHDDETGAEPLLFWGQDRLDFVEDALGGPGAAPLQASASSQSPGAGARRVDFWFDFSSPFAYLAAARIEAVAARQGAELRYRPFLLGALFKSIGTPNVPLFAMPEAKQRHVSADMARWAERFDVPLRFPSRFPMNTVKPLRMVLELEPPARPAVVRALFRAYWVDDRDLADDATLEAIANEAGLDGAALVAGTRRDEIKLRLREETEEAERANVCGAPCFVVEVGGAVTPGAAGKSDDLLFWGQDRLMFVEKALAGWRPRGE